ncbi:MAG: hypothetical protein K9N48_08430 [Verrucomicrobia bacterium]|nr:hypothetical protein [Verrucomicrobiota bacterium]MCF7709202.1 hypothetical protein [Verrucomicrobiota bacterium]
MNSNRTRHNHRRHNGVIRSSLILALLCVLFGAGGCRTGSAHPGSSHISGYIDTSIEKSF